MYSKAYRVDSGHRKATSPPKTRPRPSSLKLMESKSDRFSSVMGCPPGVKMHHATQAEVASVAVMVSA